MYVQALNHLPKLTMIMKTKNLVREPDSSTCGPGFWTVYPVQIYLLIVLKLLIMHLLVYFWNYKLFHTLFWWPSKSKSVNLSLYLFLLLSGDISISVTLLTWRLLLFINFKWTTILVFLKQIDLIFYIIIYTELK